MKKTTPKSIKTKHADLIQTAKSIMDEISDDVKHSWEHVLDVVEFTERIINELPDNTDIDAEVCMVSAYWHDVGRLHGKKGHAEASAKMLRAELEKRGFGQQFITACCDAVENHSWQDREPANLEGKIIRDADKIGFAGIRRFKVCKQRNAKFKSIFDDMPKVRNQMLFLEASQKVWDQAIVELAVYLCRELGMKEE